MRYQLKRTQQLYCDVDTAWRFFSSPHNLSDITPQDMGFNVLTAVEEDHIYEGLLIDYRVSPILRIPMRWTTLISQVDPGKSFTDFQYKGPYKYWKHYHEFIPNEHGVLMHDTVDYELPYGLLGQLGHWMIVRKKLENIFDYRYKVLERLFSKKGL